MLNARASRGGSRRDRAIALAARLPKPAKRAVRRALAARWVQACMGRSAAGRRLLDSIPPPAVGCVDMGDLRRTTPIASDFGYGRGGPVDRYYIELFLAEHSADIRGRVLEIGDDAYTRRFGGVYVARADVLHVEADSGAAFIGDLTDAALLPPDTFDCIVLTQTLHLIFEPAVALRNIRRALAPGGVLLLTVPGISNVDPGRWGSTWFYSFTEHAVARMCDEAFNGFDVKIESHGNVLAATAFLHGLAASELNRAELDAHHPEYSVIHTARVRKQLDDSETS
jgi:SAM-dependent methyltransferase